MQRKYIFYRYVSLLFGLTLGLLGLYLVYSIWPIEIFDRFIYRKSYLHGYGDHKDGKLCLAQLNSQGFRDDEIKPKIPGEYRIVVVGDSFVYGLGLLKQERFTDILEKKLNRYRKTSVINLGICGTNLYANYEIMNGYKDKLDADLTVFTVNENDLIVANDLHDYPKELNVTDNLVFVSNNLSETWEERLNRTLATFEDKSDNMKILNYLFPKLPKNNTVMYFSFRYIPTKLDFLDNILIRNGFDLIDSQELYNKKYKAKAFSNSSGKSGLMTISKMEEHPNKLANLMFAERISQELISNAKYGFIED